MDVVRWAEAAGRGLLRLGGVRRRWVATPVGRVHALELRGEGGPTVVMLHGISSSSVPFGPIMLGLRREAGRILAPDAPGHGASDEPPEATPEAMMEGLLAWFDQEVPGRAVVIGNSMGGALAMHLARERPDRVRGLLLISPGGAGMSEEGLRAFLGRFRMPDRRSGLEFLRRIYHAPPFWLPAISWAVVGVFSRPWLQRLIRGLRAEHLLTAEQFRALPAPLLILWGRSEKLMLPEMRDWFVRHLPEGGRLEEPEEFGHCPHLDRPGRLIQAVRQFLRDLPHGSV